MKNLKGKYCQIEASKMLLEILTISLIAKGMKLLKKISKPIFMEWDDYKKKVDFLNDYYFQQECRKQSIRNSPLLEN